MLKQPNSNGLRLQINSAYNSRAVGGSNVHIPN